MFGEKYECIYTCLPTSFPGTLQFLPSGAVGKGKKTGNEVVCPSLFFHLQPSRETDFLSVVFPANYTCNNMGDKSLLNFGANFQL